VKQWVRDLASVKWNRGKYSQSYQDILLERIFEQIGVRNAPPFCVEFGFNDASLTGGSGSNVANFVLNHGWRCLLLDGDHDNPSINLYRHFLTADKICDVFAEHGVPAEPEYISIDVDSTDLWLFRSLLTRYKAMVYTVEYNSCFPLDRAITFPDDATEGWQGDRGYGASLRALQMVAAEGGYSLLWVVPPADTTPTGPTIRIIRQPNAGPSAARNRGVAEARGELIALTDDDCLPTPTWLESLVAAHRQCPDSLVGGITFNGLTDDVFATTSQMIVDLVYEHFNADEASAYFLASNNILCSRVAYSELGGFDTSFPRAGAEDRDFCDRWRASGRPLRLVPTARIEHRHAQNLNQFLGLHYCYGRGAYRYQDKRRERGSGTMAQDMNFHGSLLRRLPRHLRTHRGLFRKVQITTAIVLWQVANAAGFFHEAVAQLFAGKTAGK
jgi:GT2 family glycosyltransferase